MPDQRPSTPASDAIRALSQFLHEPDSAELPIEQVRAELKQAKLNATDIKKQFADALAKAKGRAVLAEASERRERFLQRAGEIAKTPPGSLKARVSELVEELFGSGQEAAVAWRNFEHKSEDDLRSMLEDLTLLEELEKDDANPPS